MLWLRLRCLLLRLLGLSSELTDDKSNHHAVNGSDKENAKELPIEDLSTTLTELEKVIEKASRKIDHTEEVS